MKKLAFILCLISAPAFADDKPPVWVMMVQFKTASINATYASEDICKDAVKFAATHLKKLGGSAGCFPVMQK